MGPLAGDESSGRAIASCGVERRGVHLPSFEAHVEDLRVAHQTLPEAANLKLHVPSAELLDLHLGYSDNSTGNQGKVSICMPPFEEEGVYCFAHVGRYVGLSVGPPTRWFPDDNSRTLGARIMKLHREIDHDSQMTPIDVQVTRYIDHDWQMTPIDFEVTRWQAAKFNHTELVGGLNSHLHDEF
ncbi:hypothetical protein DPMN_018583 [Dreissena polymorpha]|uniref:Uncharacterized protein n=1 Tax=Dreissena polymorpha TaxID=45954 RepID=A0A9D4NGU4_DREPO|nr:hypothetical protein DPMN_018583 [Dreissena polymorpha]